ncbi:MAG: 50S ribosomal protein L28 [Atribacterota bacterium]|nr:50S ribosomal protein L28 [Atribacterota bacterium]
MAKCDICGKTPLFGKQISHSHKLSNRKWSVNIQKVKVVIDKTIRKVNVCTKCLKSGKVQKVA